MSSYAALSQPASSSNVIGRTWTDAEARTLTCGTRPGSSSTMIVASANRVRRAAAPERLRSQLLSVDRSLPVCPSSLAPSSRHRWSSTARWIKTEMATPLGGPGEFPVAINHSIRRCRVQLTARPTRGKGSYHRVHCHRRYGFSRSTREWSIDVRVGRMIN